MTVRAMIDMRAVVRNRRIRRIRVMVRAGSLDMRSGQGRRLSNRARRTSRLNHRRSCVSVVYVRQQHLDAAHQKGERDDERGNDTMKAKGTKHVARFDECKPLDLDSEQR